MQDDPSWKLIAGVVGLLLAIAVGGWQQQRMNTPPDDEWFQGSVIEHSGVVVVKFGAEWCGPCRSMHKELQRLKGKGLAGLKVVEIDIDKKPELAQHYGVRGIPRTLVFVDGEYQTGKTGSMPAEQLEAWVRPYVDDYVASF